MGLLLYLPNLASTSQNFEGFPLVGNFLVFGLNHFENLSLLRDFLTNFLHNFSLLINNESNFSNFNPLLYDL